MKKLLVWLVLFSFVATNVLAGNSVLDTLMNAEESGVSEAQAPIPAPITTSVARQQRAESTAELMDGVHALVMSSVASNTVSKSPWDNTPITTLLSMVKSIWGVTFAGINLIGNKWVIPTNTLWTREQVLWTFKCLLTLPQTMVKCVTQLVRVQSYGGVANVLGYVYRGFSRIYLCNSTTRTMGYYAQTLVHELGHLFAFSNKTIEQAFRTKFWVKAGVVKTGMKLVSTYARTNWDEDFAESVKCFWYDGATMKKTCPDRYEFIRVNVFGGVASAKRSDFSL